MPTKMNDREIDSMFDDIGKAKENMAKGIVEQQKKEAEEARKHRPFGGGEELYGVCFFEQRSGQNFNNIVVRHKSS